MTGRGSRSTRATPPRRPRDDDRPPISRSRGHLREPHLRDPVRDSARDPARDTTRSAATDPKRAVADLAAAWKQMEQKLDQLSGRQHLAARNEMVEQMREVAAASGTIRSYGRRSPASSASSACGVAQDWIGPFANAIWSGRCGRCAIGIGIGIGIAGGSESHTALHGVRCSEYSSHKCIQRINGTCSPDVFRHPLTARPRPRRVEGAASPPPIWGRCSSSSGCSRFETQCVSNWAKGNETARLVSGVEAARIRPVMI